MNKCRIFYAFTALCTLSFTYSNPHTIVFVHLGESLPDYLYDAVEQAELFNSPSHIYVIANKSAINAISRPLEVQMIACEELSECNEHTEFLQTSTLNTTFKNGFWRKTTERFFYLYEFMKMYNVEDVFHLEYDNLLYVDLEELLPIFQKYYKTIGAIFDTEHRSVPNFMYIVDAQALHPLIGFIAFNASNGMNDMNSIGLYRKQTLNMIESLPVIPKGDDLFQKDVNEPELFWHGIEWFGSLFDGAALGQFLGGIDPCNGAIGPGFINKDAVYDASRFVIDWECDTEHRKIPYCNYHGRKYRINNLHIHSKQLKRFKS